MSNENVNLNHETVNPNPMEEQTMTTDLTITQQQTDEQSYSIDPESQNMLPVAPLEQDEELNAMQFHETGYEPEASSMNPLRALSDKIPKLEQHEYGKMFPPMSKSEFNDIVEDIRKHGLQEKIVMLDGMVLDGWHRYLVLLKLGIFDPALHCKEYKGNNPVTFVLSKNLHRRHLTLNDSQRAMLVADMETYTHGGNRKNQDGSIHLETRKELAKAADVSPSSVARAKKVKESSHEDAQDIRDGKTTIGTVTKRLRKAAKGKPQSKRSLNADPTQAEPVPSEWMQAAKNAWWHIPARGMCTPHDDILEVMPDAINKVKRAIEENALSSLLVDLQDVQALVNAGGTELTAEKTDNVIAAVETLNEVVAELIDYCLNDLQMWSSIQKGDTDWTPFDHLPSYRKGKLQILDIIKAVTHVLSSVGWSEERIAETLISLTGNDTMPDGVPMSEVVEHNVLLRAGDKWNDRRVKGFKEVSQWLREWKGIDIPEPQK